MPKKFAFKALPEAGFVARGRHCGASRIFAARRMGGILARELHVVQHMEIALFSNDPELQVLCHDIVRAIPGAKCTIRQKADTASDLARVVCIYDTVVQPLGLHLGLAHTHNSIFVVNRAELPHIRSNIVGLKAIVLLKPVSRGRLEFAIEQIAQRMNGSSGDAGCDVTRMNSQELLDSLWRANLRLEELDQERTDFLARAVHELRAPLTSLNGYCGLFLDNKIGSLSSEQVAVLSRMKRSVIRLARIVSTIFDLSAGRSCESVPRYELGNIVVCLEQALHEIGPMMDDRRIEPDIEISSPAGLISFDAQQMEEVFVNVLENSSKYSPRGGMVQIRGYPFFWDRRAAHSHATHEPERRRSAAQSIPNSYRIDIADNGPGIPPDQLERTFDGSSVYCGGGDRSGAGLGLAISKMIVRQHGGRIWVESKDAKGSLFCIVLPYSVCARHACQGY